jgi:hypothetical protein
LCLRCGWAGSVVVVWDVPRAQHWALQRQEASPLTLRGGPAVFSSGGIRSSLRGQVERVMLGATTSLAAKMARVSIPVVRLVGCKWTMQWGQGQEHPAGLAHFLPHPVSTGPGCLAGSAGSWETQESPLTISLR